MCAPCAETGAYEAVWARMADAAEADMRLRLEKRTDCPLPAEQDEQLQQSNAS